MNKIFIPIISFLATLVCCNDNPVGDGTADYLHLSGRVVADFPFNKIYSNISRDTTLFWDEYNVNPDGTFQLQIPIPSNNNMSYYLPDNKISVIENDTTLYIDSVAIESKYLKYFRSELYINNLNEVSTRHLINESKFTNKYQWAEEGDYFISYYYFNSPTNIGGYYKIRMINENPHKEFIVNYNIKVTKGWNKIVYKVISVDNNELILQALNLNDEKSDWVVSSAHYFPIFIKIL